MKKGKRRETTGQEGLFGPEEGAVARGDRGEGAGQWVTGGGGQVIRVAFETGGDNVYDYAVPEELEGPVTMGQRVRGPFGKGNKLQTGFCVALPEQASVPKVKAICEIVDPHPLLDSDRMQLAQWISQYYCCALGQVLSAMVPRAVKEQVGMVKRVYVRLTEAAGQKTEGLAGVHMSEKGRSIVEWLRQAWAGGRVEAPLDEAAAAVRCGKGPFQTLARAGLIEWFSRREMPGAKGTGSPLSEPAGKAPAAEITLTEDQRAGLATIEELIEREEFHTVLLRGVTGSGKTEVYLRSIEAVLKRGRQGLVLVPEIALTPQTVRWFEQRFGRVAVLHSGLSATERHQQWRSIAEGQVEVVVGARSAVFAPLPKLGLIVVDEEHEPSYKQDSTPRYHGRDVAIKLAQIKGIAVILGSATPSLESLLNSRQKGHYHLVELPKRVQELPLPAVTVVSMREEALRSKGHPIFSGLLEGALRKCLQQKQQAILLLNRRGHSSYVFCPSCQFVLKCPNCDVSLTYHKSKKDFETTVRSWVMCHHCLHSSMVPKVCPLCGKRLLLIGPGTQKAEEQLAQKIPEARIYRVDSDSMKPGQYAEVLEAFGAGQIDFLLGTQMIGKGLDFPHVSLVGVLNADTALSLPDFRSSERTFQLLTQVAGRCGRAEATGQVIIQSYNPEEPVIQLACRHDYVSFARRELEIRQQCQMPPYWRLARIVLRDTKLEKVEQAAARLRQGIDQCQTAMKAPVEIRGPIPAGIAYLENYHRQEILLRAAGPGPIQRLLSQLRQKELPSLGVQAVVDVDPVNFL